MNHTGMAQTNQVNLDIDDDHSTEPAPQNIPSPPRQESGPRPVEPRNNAGFGDRLNNVFREFRPIVQQAQLGNNARLSLPTWWWLPRQQPVFVPPEAGPQRPQSSVAHVNLGPNAQSYTIRERVSPSHQRSQGVASSTSNESNLSEASPDQHEINISVNPANNNNIPDNNVDTESQSDDGMQQTVDVRATLALLLKYCPFYLILLVKFMYDSREGLFTFFVLMCTFAHSNSLVRREHGKQGNRSIGALLLGLVATACCLAAVHVVLGHGRLLPNVVMFPGYSARIDVWELLWLVVLTDVVVRIVTVDLKILLTVLPAALVPFQKRGKVYLFIEAVSQLYRSLLTIQPWVFFLMNSYEGSEKMVGMLLTSIYVICKVVELLLKFRMFKNATWTLLQSVNLGSKPSREALQLAGAACPICHDDYCSPVQLGCSHIFCELCIAAWLDREHTCPLCRARVAQEPLYRDGSTTYDFQLY